MKTSLGIVTMLFGLSAVAPAITIWTLTPSDNRTVSDLTTTTALNTVDSGSVASATYTARNRSRIGENAKQTASFLQYDLSTLTAAQVNSPSFSAKFQIDFVARLNNLNPGMAIALGRNVSGPWNSGGNLNPLHDWGWKDEDSTVTAGEIGVLVTELKTAPFENDIELDVTGVVQDWVNGVNSNWGFVLYGKTNIPNAGGFNNADLILTVPDPSTTFTLFGLSGLALVALKKLDRRRLL